MSRHNTMRMKFSRSDQMAVVGWMNLPPRGVDCNEFLSKKTLALDLIQVK